MNKHKGKQWNRYCYITIKLAVFEGWISHSGYASSRKSSHCMLYIVLDYSLYFWWVLCMVLITLIVDATNDLTLNIIVLIFSARTMTFCPVNWKIPNLSSHPICRDVVLAKLRRSTCRFIIVRSPMTHDSSSNIALKVALNLIFDVIWFDLFWFGLIIFDMESVMQCKHIILSSVKCIRHTLTYCEWRFYTYKESNVGDMFTCNDTN